jgi:NitT/TauT family transport system substrate-binding protein
LYFNEGAAANNRSRFNKEYGFNVEFILENDLMTALNAWMAGEYDIMVQTADAFPLYTGPADINAFAPKAIMQVDWSRGGDAIIVKRGINSVNDLKGKRIAVAVPSPAQTLLTSSLEAAGLNYSDVTVIKTSDNLKAAELFRSNDIDAAVVWSPDDILATRDVPGSKILLTTREQSHIIADIMFASQKTINQKKEMIHGFYEGWMKGLAEVRANKSNREKAAKYLAELNGLTPEDALGMMDNVYWTSHGDNVNFFGLNPDYKGMKGDDIYTKMAKKFVETGDLTGGVPPFRSVAYLGGVQAADVNLTGQAYAAESQKTFAPSTPAAAKAPAIASKPISIKFETGKFMLDENAKTIIDMQFKDVARTFGSVKIRVEGNTDNVGSRKSNMVLSEKRAKAVADYLKSEYGMDPNRFVIVGNGPDKPVPGCETNATENCKAQNRRTEFVLINE